MASPGPIIYMVTLNFCMMWVCSTVILLQLVCLLTFSYAIAVQLQTRTTAISYCWKPCTTTYGFSELLKLYLAMLLIRRQSELEFNMLMSTHALAKLSRLRPSKVCRLYPHATCCWQSCNITQVRDMVSSESWDT